MPIQIYGKSYTMVHERMRALQETELPYEITESYPFPVGDRWLWKVTLIVDGRTYVGNAEAKIGNARVGSPDASNPFECAETSALGRALGFAGFGAIESIASADEIVRGQSQDGGRPLPPRPKVKDHGE